MTALSRATFTAEFLYEHGRLHAINGYTSGETWNGWQCPYFTLDGMHRLAELLKRLRADKPDLVVIEEDEQETGTFWLLDSEDAEYCDPIQPAPHDTVDGTLQLYYMGGSWIWDLNVQ